MTDYDNSRYTYNQVIAGAGYYMQGAFLRFSEGVYEM